MINLAEKYEKQLAEGFTHESYVAGTTSNKYNWNGVESINIYTLVHDDLVDYTIGGTNRYGIPTEVQDTVQNIKITRDRGFTKSIDKKYNTMQMQVKKAGEYIRGQIREKIGPEMDKYALAKFVDFAGHIEVATETPTKATLVQKISDAMVYLSNIQVPEEGRYIYIGWTNFGMLRLAPEFMNIDNLGEKHLTKGTVGAFMGAKVVAVPDNFLMKGTNKVDFLIYIKDAVFLPKKIEEFHIHQDAPGISGHLIEGRVVYDAAVLGAKADAVYAYVEPSTQQAAPTFAFSGSTLTITSTGATKILVTTDGTDPRFSKTAIATTTGGTITLPTGKYKAKAVAFDDVLFTSAVATDTERTVA